MRLGWKSDKVAVSIIQLDSIRPGSTLINGQAIKIPMIKDVKSRTYYKWTTARLTVSACRLYMGLFLQKPTSATTQQDGLDLDTYIMALQDDNTTSPFPTKISHISV